MNKYEGNDNYGKPRQEYVDKIAALSDSELQDECRHKIWLSAYANNNPRSDFHWHVDALYDECIKRDPSADNYKRAYANAFPKD